MGPNDVIYHASNSTRIPFLPPCTPEQAEEALRNVAPGIGATLSWPTPHLSGLGRLPGPGMQPNPERPGLAGALLVHGITNLPYCDPRLVDVTQNRTTPEFETPKGTVIRLNKAAPGTYLPQGTGLDHLITFADSLGPGKVVISGGSESGPGQHTLDSVHPGGGAIDVSAENDVDDESVRRAALAGGYTHGMFEIRPSKNPGDPPVKHWHLQVGPKNILNPGLYDLTRGPIRTKDYTKSASQAGTSGPGGG